MDGWMEKVAQKRPAGSRERERKKERERDGEEKEERVSSWMSSSSLRLSLQPTRTDFGREELHREKTQTL